MAGVGAVVLVVVGTGAVVVVVGSGLGASFGSLVPGPVEGAEGDAVGWVGEGTTGADGADVIRANEAGGAPAGGAVVGVVGAVGPGELDDACCSESADWRYAARPPSASSRW